MSYLIIGIDPGTGSSSPTGFTVFNPETLELHYAANVGTSRKEVHHRIREISDIISNTFSEIEERFADKHIIVAVEHFVMKGKGGETLHRLIGSIIGRLPYHWTLLNVSNTTVKLQVAGSGKAEKQEVARGLAEIFGDNESSLRYIQSWTKAGEYDLLDSLAIGITAWHQIKGTVRKPKKATSSKRSPTTRS